MKALAVSLIWMCSVFCSGGILPGVVLEIRGISSEGTAVIYSGENPIDIVSLSVEFDQILNPILRFKNIEEKSLRVVFSGKAKFEFRLNEVNSGVDLQSLIGISPNEKEIQSWIKKLRSSIKERDGESVSRFYFSGENGTNPDIELSMPSGKSKLSKIVKETFSSAKNVEILSRIKFRRGKNYAVVYGDGENGKINLSVDGNTTWLIPIFIYKRHKGAPIETL